MKYADIVKGKFISRPNRFVASVEIDGEVKVCHVKNTGRCKELLGGGETVILERSKNPARKTEFDLVGVYKGRELINIDSMAPNKVFYEWLSSTDMFGEIKYIKPECKYKNSRFDFYIKTEKEEIFAEIKGVTLENDGVVLFPDAPTLRGLKHINELIKAAGEGYGAYIFFIIQMKNCKYFTPNKETHKEFAEALKTAKESGVKIYALNCEVFEDEISASRFVEVIL